MRADDGADGPEHQLVGVRFGTSSPFEQRFGYSRVVRVGPLALTAGCTATIDGVVQAPGDAAGQAAIAFGVGLGALARVGLGSEAVIATRMYIVDPGDADAVGLVHSDVFGQVRPVATMVVVAGLIDPAMLIEVELTAWAG
jgi:enamine deaminase RidA (YjgF/YER057c/UK114 family)